MVTTQRALYVSPSRTLVAEATPGLILQSSVGRVTWEEFEPVIQQVHTSSVAGPRYVFLFRLAVASPRDLPDEEFRKRVGDSAREHTDRIAAFAYVIPYQGFLSATIHAMIAGITTVSRTPHPERAFTAALPAAEWLGRQFRLPSSPAEVVDRLDALTELHQREP